MVKFLLLIGVLHIIGLGTVFSLPYHDPHCEGKQVVVHLFNWKWTDIALECERVLGPKGFCAVQISPPNEHIVEVPKRPWSERYAPVSYKLTSRSGTEAELRDMVIRCKRAGVRIYADVVINHMCGWEFMGFGSAGSQFDGKARYFPGVPYNYLDFNSKEKCPSHDGKINNYNDASEVRNCMLGSLTDLDQSKERVRMKITNYLNSLIDMGVAGFRVDAAKHMWPHDLSHIWENLYSVDGKRPFMIMETIPGGAVRPSEYYHLGYVTEFTYGYRIEGAVDNFGTLAELKLGEGITPPGHALVFVDNHDNQRDGRLSFKNPTNYKRAQAFTLALDFGFPRVMSSYYFSDRTDPPPHDGDVLKDVIIDSQGNCGNGWVCEHRWTPIANMVQFRNDVANTRVTNVRVTDGHVISFSRDAKGFFAMGKQNFNISVYTGLPEGTYCDLISECALTVTVDVQGFANIYPHDGSEPFVAFTTASKTGAPHTPPVAAPTVPSTVEDYKRTVVMIEKQTIVGQDVFIRGGLDHGRFQGCDFNVSTSPCSIPIRHRQTGTSPHYTKVNTWSEGDNFLDWFGAELGQGEHENQRAHGTPAFWSTNINHGEGYSPLNVYGQHYWIVDVDMDCSRTENGFFELKAMLNGAWENDIVQHLSPCTGNCARAPGFESTNHIAQCGYVNVFHFNTNACEVKSFDGNTC